MNFSTRVLVIDRDEPDLAALDEAAGVLRRGGLVAFATETVYGLGADATNPEAVARIFEAKGRPSFNPLIVHADGGEMARSCVSDWPDRAALLKKRFWPGPLTLVLPRSGIIPDIVTAGGDTVGVRIPKPFVARGLIQRTGRPIAAPSANRSTGISPTLATHVLKDLDGKIDMVLDSGPTTVGIESTVLDLSGQVPRILRPGSITAEQLREALGVEVEGPDPSMTESRSPSSPGQMPIHYAPRTPTYRVDRETFSTLPGPGCWVMLSIGPPSAWPRGRGPSWHHRLRTPEQAERWLYDFLHTSDDGRYDFLIIVPPPDEPQWLAIRDRVWRASRPWPGEG